MIGSSFSSFAVSPSARQREARCRGSDDDQLVVVRALVDEGQRQVAARHLLRGRDAEVAFDDPQRCGFLRDRVCVHRERRAGEDCSEDNQAPRRDASNRIGPESAPTPKPSRPRPGLGPARSRRISRNRLWDSTRRGSFRGGLGWSHGRPILAPAVSEPMRDVTPSPTCCTAALTRAPCGSAAPSTSTCCRRATRAARPVRTSRPGSRTQAGRHEQAWRELVADNPLPAIHGRVCYHPCESVCNRASLDGSAVSITRSSGSWATSRWSRGGSSTGRSS